MISGRDLKMDTRQGTEELTTRHAGLHGEMVDHLEETAALENHGLIYTLVAWEHLIACAVSNYLIALVPLQHPHRWPYLLPWAAWIIVALGTVRLVRVPAAGESSPLAGQLTRLWIVFFLLCGNVVGLNLLSGLPIFVFLPVLATLSSFALSVLTLLVSRRFLPASVLMFATGLGIAWFPDFGFLIYGCSWLVVLQGVGVHLIRRRRHLLAEEQYRTQVLPFSRAQ